MGNTVQTTLQIGLDTAPLQTLLQLLQGIATNAQAAQAGVSGIGKNVKVPPPGAPAGPPAGSGGPPPAPGGGGGGPPPPAPWDFRAARGRVNIGGDPRQPTAFDRRYQGGAGAHLFGTGMQQTAGAVTSAVGAYYAQEPLLAGAFATGNLSTAANAAIQAQSARETSMRSAAAGGVGGTLQAAAGMAGMAMGGPGGMVAGAAAGALLNMAIQWGATAANALTQTLAAKQSGAVAFGENLMGRGKAQAEAALGGMPYGTNIARGRLGTLSGTYGYSPEAIQQTMAGFGRGGGHTPLAEAVLGLQRAGIDAGTTARFQRSTFGASGARLSDQSDFGVFAAMDRTLANAVASGVQRSRLPEYMARVASYNEKMAERGTAIDYGESERTRVGFANTGLRGFAVNAVQESTRDYGFNATQGLASMRLPPAMAQSLVQRALIRKFGGVDAAIRGGSEMTRTDSWGEFLGGTTRGLPEQLGVPMMMGITGMDYEGASRARQMRKGGSISDMMRSRLQPGWGGWWSEANKNLNTEEGGLVRTAAGRDAAEGLGASLGRLTGIIEKSYEVLEAAQKNFQQNYNAAISRAIEELRQPAGRGPLDRALDWDVESP